MRQASLDVSLFWGAFVNVYSIDARIHVSILDYIGF